MCQRAGLPWTNLNANRSKFLFDESIKLLMPVHETSTSVSPIYEGCTWTLHEADPCCFNIQNRLSTDQLRAIVSLLRHPFRNTIMYKKMIELAKYSNEKKSFFWPCADTAHTQSVCVCVCVCECVWVCVFVCVCVFDRECVYFVWWCGVWLCVRECSTGLFAWREAVYCWNSYSRRKRTKNK